MSSPESAVDFHGLLEMALPGTQRQGVVAPQLAGTVGVLLADIAASSQPPARQLLQMAGVVAVCSRAGFQPAPIAAPAWEPAPLETHTMPSAELAEQVLRPLLIDGPQRLQHLALTRLAERGLALPPNLLPTALDMGRRNVAIRPALTGALGTRGRWLALQSSSWSYAAGVSNQASTQEQWELGTPDQRLAAFAEMRQSDPEAARTTLAAELKTLSATERGALLPVLAVNLSASDEPLLDSLLLKDRGSEVRQAAANLLARLPQSRHALAITAALAPLVKIERGILFGKKCVIDVPAAADPAWKNEAIDATRPQHEVLGERAWWLYQLVRRCPLDWWQQHTGLTAAELIKATAKSEWQKALVRGWRDAVVATQHPAWAEALMQNTPLLKPILSNNASHASEAAALLAVLPLAQREQYWAENTPSEKHSLGRFLQHILLACPIDHQLSPQLSQRLAQAIAHELHSGAANSAQGIDYSLQYALPDMLCVLDVSCLGPIASVPGLDPRLARIITARKAL